MQEGNLGEHCMTMDSIAEFIRPGPTHSYTAGNTQKEMSEKKTLRMDLCIKYICGHRSLS